MITQQEIKQSLDNTRSSAQYFLRNLKDQVARLEAALASEYPTNSIAKAHDVAYSAAQIESHMVQFETLKEIYEKL